MNGNANGVTAGINGINGSVTARTATLGTPATYAYTSSGGLLSRGERAGCARPVPPPTLPKYSGSFSAGSAGAFKERDREGAGGSHRLASLERLALRQRIIEQSSNNQLPATGVTALVTAATVTLTDTAT